MLTRWLTFTALLAGSASPERAEFTVAPTRRVKGHPEAELTLNCGDGKSAGVVQYWHTPFGDLQTPGSHSDLDPVFMHHDGSLVVPNTSSLHSGLYYCLLQHTEGTTLWPYKLHVSQNTQKNHEHSKQEQHSSSGGGGAFRFRRDVGSGAERQAGVSDRQFAGAVAASVLLTFVLGFSAGALSRTHVLRCLGAVTSRLRLPWKRRNQTNSPDHSAEVTMSTLPPMYGDQSFEMEQVWDDNSANCASMNSTISSTTSFPPAKPKRSFRNKRQEEQETTAYLEGCDYTKEEERRTEEAAGRGVEDRNKGGEGETEEEQEEQELCLSEDGRSQTETDEECSEEKDWRQEEQVEENRGKEGGEWTREGEEEVKGRDEEREKEGKKEWRQEEEVEAGDQNRSKRGEERSEEVKGRAGEEGDDGEKTRSEEDGETDSEDDEAGSQKHEDTASSGVTEGEAASSPSHRRRRSRVIRLYQYDDDGQRYGHLPDPTPDERGPAPRLKQRSLSLTRLSAIMAAASAGPLDTREERMEETEDRLHFHMDI